MLEIIFYIVLIIVIAGLIMIGTNILYDLAAAVLPFAAILLVAVGVVVGLVEAVRNTFSAYKDVYGKGGRKK